MAGYGLHALAPVALPRQLADTESAGGKRIDDDGGREIFVRRVGKRVQRLFR